MNLRRVALAAVVAWVVYMALGFVVHGVLLKDTYLQYASVMRPEADQNAVLPIAFGGSLVGFFAFAYAYAKGYEGGSGVQEGMRFGVLVGIMLCVFSVSFEYMMWPIGRRLLAAWIVDYIIEFAIYGMLVGSLYKPLASPARRTVAV